MKKNRLKIRLTLFVSTMATMLFLAIAGASIAMIANLAIKEKSSDSQINVYQALEIVANDMERLLYQEYVGQTKNGESAYYYDLNTKQFKPKIGSLLPTLEINNVSINNPSNFNTPINVFLINGMLYGISKSQSASRNEFLIYKSNLIKLTKDLIDFEKDSVIYILNREGQLIYSNSNLITQDKVFSRELVRESVQLRYKNAQLSLKKDPNSKEYFEFGFFEILENTNLVLYVETRHQYFIEKIISGLKPIAYGTLAGIVIFFILMRLLASSIRTSFLNIISGVQYIANAKFNEKVSESLISEFSFLSNALNKTSKAMLKRDALIRANFIKKGEQATIDTLKKALDLVAGDDQDLRSTRLICSFLNMSERLSVFYRNAIGDEITFYAKIINLSDKEDDVLAKKLALTLDLRRMAILIETGQKESFFASFYDFLNKLASEIIVDISTMVVSIFNKKASSLDIFHLQTPLEIFAISGDHSLVFQSTSIEQIALGPDVILNFQRFDLTEKLDLFIGFDEQGKKASRYQDVVDDDNFKHVLEIMTDPETRGTDIFSQQFKGEASGDNLDFFIIDSRNDET